MVSLYKTSDNTHSILSPIRRGFLSLFFLRLFFFLSFLFLFFFLLGLLLHKFPLSMKFLCYSSLKRPQHRSTNVSNILFIVDYYKYSDLFVNDAPK